MPTDPLAAFELYPQLREQLEKSVAERIGPYLPELMRRIETDGMDEAMRWVQVLLGQVAEQH
jgi:hypothetical protein